jgi:hypothetical protein
MEVGRGEKRIKIQESRIKTNNALQNGSFRGITFITSQLAHYENVG